MTTVTDPREFFRQMPGVGRLEDSPLWPIRLAFDDRSWAQAPVEQVPVASLCRTQRRVFLKYLGGKGNDRAVPGRDRPWIVRARGRCWIADGHHRVVDAVLAGEVSIEAYVREQPEGEQS